MRFQKEGEKKVETNVGKTMSYLDKIIHINASPEFLANPENLKALEQLVEKAYHYKPNRMNTPNKLEFLAPEEGDKFTEREVTPNVFTITYQGEKLRVKISKTLGQPDTDGHYIELLNYPAFYDNKMKKLVGYAFYKILPRFNKKTEKTYGEPVTIYELIGHYKAHALTPEQFSDLMESYAQSMKNYYIPLAQFQIAINEATDWQNQMTEEERSKMPFDEAKARVTQRIYDYYKPLIKPEPDGTKS